MRPGSTRSNLSAAATFAGLWTGFAVLYLSLRSNQYTAVDGALRCLAVYWRRPPYIGSNNHLLYPADVYAWTAFLKSIGATWNSPVAFIRSVQAMNAIFGAGAAALVYLLVRRVSSSAGCAIVSAGIYGISHAVLMHAANSAEPVVGLFFSLLATMLAIEGIAGTGFIYLLSAGFTLALALANYESMVLVGPSIFLMALFLPATVNTPSDIGLTTFDPPASFKEAARRSKRLVAMGTGFLAGVALIYGGAYYSAGVDSPRAMAVKFFRMGGEPKVYGGWSLSKVVNFPIGMIGNLAAVLPQDYGGLRLLFRDRNILSLALILMIAAILIAAAAIIMPELARRRRRSGPSWAICMISAFGAAIVFFPNFYWDPIYDKLWLQPLALMVAAGGIAAGKIGGTARRALSAVAALLIASELAFNLPAAWNAHHSSTRCIEDAQAVARIIRPKDKVVADFDFVSSLWLGLYNTEPSRALLFPAESPAVSVPTLARWKDRCAAEGCVIFFIGLLNQSRKEWTAFLGNHVGVPYEALASYRSDAKPVLRFSCEEGYLRAFTPARPVGGRHQ